MFKRILSMILCITLVCLIAMPVTADETKETKQTQETARSMEEILNDYHARSAALTTAGANSRAASTDAKTQLKQETIAELNAAGYSAYDVNPVSYNDLEETLQTDFSQMGLDPNGSYIIVISGEEGEEEEEKPANGTRDATQPPHLYDPEFPGGGDTFFYKRGNKSYLMRYLTVVSSGGEDLKDWDIIRSNEYSDPTWLLNFLSAANYIVGESVDQYDSTYVDIVLTLLSVFITEPDDINGIEWEAIASWKIKYTQIYRTGQFVWNEWQSCSAVERVYVHYNIKATYYDETAGSDHEGGTVTATEEGEYGILKTEHYDDTDWQKSAAAAAFDAGEYDFEEIKYVDVVFTEQGNSNNVVAEMTLCKPSVH